MNNELKKDYIPKRISLNQNYPDAGRGQPDKESTQLEGKNSEKETIVKREETIIDKFKTANAPEEQ